MNFSPVIVFFLETAFRFSTPTLVKKLMVLWYFVIIIGLKFVSSSYAQQKQ